MVFENLSRLGSIQFYKCSARLGVHLLGDARWLGIGSFMQRRLDPTALIWHPASALHQLDAHTIGCCDIAQQPPANPFLQRDRKGDTLRPQLVAECR